MTRVLTECQREVEAAVKLLESRCAAIDLHYSRFPNTLDRTMEDTAKAIRLVLGTRPKQGDYE